MAQKISKGNKVAISYARDGKAQLEAEVVRRRGASVRVVMAGGYYFVVAVADIVEVLS